MSSSSYIVIFKEELLAGACPTILSTSIKNKYNLEITSSLNSTLKGFSTNLTEKHVAEIKQHPSVETVLKDFKISLVNNPENMSNTSIKDNNIPWGISEINPPIISTGSISSSKYTSLAKVDVDVYVIDTGVSPHTYVNLVESVSMLSSTSSMHGHASHVSGIIGASKNITNGVVGVAPGARIHSVRVLDENGEGMMSWILSGIDFVTRRKIDNVPLVANLSLGFELDSPTMVTYLDKAIEIAASKGVIFVVAAGNNRRNSQLTSPAHSTSVITVAAYDKNKCFCEFSNFGSCIDICAPGEDIVSTWKNDSYAMLSGTSMAAPFITGIVSLYLSVNKSAKLSQVAEMLNKYKAAGILKTPTTDTSNNFIHLPNKFQYSGLLENIKCVGRGKTFLKGSIEY